MSSSTLSKTIATTIFAILASYALFESHALSYLCRSLIANYNKQLPSNLEKWRQPEIGEDEQQIWRSLDEVFRNAGFTLWRHAFHSVFTTGTYPLSSGFGYAIPSRADNPNGLGGVMMLQEF